MNMSRFGLWAGRVSCLSSLLTLVAAPSLNAQRVVDLPAQDREISQDLTDLYSVGSLVGDEWETFAGVDRVAFDAEGNLYILDADNFRIVVVDADGEFVREFGSEGGGPGELRMPSNMVVLPDGQVAVQDMGHSAFVLYDVNGEFVRNVRNDFQTGLLTGSIDYHPRGGIVGATTAITIRSTGGGASVGTTGDGSPIRYVPLANEDPAIEELARAYRPPPPTASGGGQSFSSSGGSIRLSSMPRMTAFGPPIGTTVLPDGRIAVIDSVGYVVKLLDGQGELGSVLSRPIEPRPVTARDEEAERERRLEALEAGEGPQMRMMVRGGGGSGGGGSATIGSDAMKDMQRQMIESLVFAEEMPVLSRVEADWEGRLWVERAGQDIGEDGPTDLVTGDGEYLGTIAADGMRIPDAFGPNGLVAYIETDEFDVASVVVKRLR